MPSWPPSHAQPVPAACEVTAITVPQRSRLLVLVFAWVVLLLCHPISSLARHNEPAEEAFPTKPVRVGIFAFRPKGVMDERFSELGSYLTQQLNGTPVQILPLTDTELEAALQRKELDFILTNPTHFIQLRETGQLSGALATMVMRQGNQPIHGIGGVIIRKAERTDLSDLRALEGKRIAIAGRHFLGTYMAPAYELLHGGVDLRSVRWVETTQPVDQVISSVLSGKADAGFARTGVLEDLIHEGKLKPEELAVIHPQTHPGFGNVVSTRLYPEWPFLAASTVSPRLSLRITAALLSLRPDQSACVQAGIYGFGIPADYSSVEQAMRELRMAPFSNPPKLSWHDVWQQYGGWIAVLSVLTSAAMALVATLFVQQKRLLATQQRLKSEHTSLQNTTTRLNYLMASSPVMFYTLQVNGPRTHITWLSSNIQKLLGYTAEQAMQHSWWKDHLHPADSRRAIDAIHQLHRLGHIRQTYRFCTANGDYRWFETDVRLLEQRVGQPLEALGMWRDITQDQHHQDQLRLAASVFANSYDGVIITNARHDVQDTNPAFTRITGRSLEQVRDHSLSALLAQGPDADPLLWPRVVRGLRQLAHWSGELPLQGPLGRLLHCAASISAVTGGDGFVTHHVVVLTDITPLKAHQSELDRLAHYDALTGVPNRRMLLDRLTQAMDRARRGHHTLAVCYLDLDDFKPVNDRLGHAVGDQLLIRMTERLQSQLRGHDTLARLGGDEFVLLLTDMVYPNEWENVVERVMQAVQEPVSLGEHSVTVSVSVGVAVFPEDDADGDTLLRHADQAMYQAKQAGRNRVHRFDQTLDREVQIQREQLERLQQAIRNNELVLHYQPKVDLDTGHVIGAEALVRWQHPEQGLLPPGAFLWQAAGTQVEVELGEWVIREALIQRETWRRTELPVPSDFCISINISGQQLLKPGFAMWLQHMLAQHPLLVPGDIELEILESAALADTHAAANVMAECRTQGLRFALDDFGTGYSSLAYFRTLPVDVIKIDQGFVRDMLDDPDDQGIVQSVVYLAHAFHRPVIAEGVETPEHARALVKLGCHLAQGYGIGKPMPAHAWPQWLEHWSVEQLWNKLS